MEENQYARVIYHPLEKITKDGIEYTFFCKRKDEMTAKLVADDLIYNNKKCLITQDSGEYIVWRS